MVELTLPDDSPFAGKRVGDVAWPARHGAGRHHPRGPPDRAQPRTTRWRRSDELLFLTTPDVEDDLEAMLSPSNRQPRGRV